MPMSVLDFYTLPNARQYIVKVFSFLFDDCVFLDDGGVNVHKMCVHYIGSEKLLTVTTAV